MSSMQLHAVGNKEDTENNLLRVYHAQFLKQRVLAIFNSFPSVENQVTHLIFFFFGVLLQLLEDSQTQNQKELTGGHW